MGAGKLGDRVVRIRRQHQIDGLVDLCEGTHDEARVVRVVLHQEQSLWRRDHLFRPSLPSVAASEEAR
ncbi:hypothetical protein D9M72_600880 [compost metagenome]